MQLVRPALTALIASLVAAAGVDAAPSLLVLDGGYHDIRRFDAESGALIESFGRADLYDSLQMAAGPDGALYVSHYAAGKVMKLDGTTGAVLDEEVLNGRPVHLRFGPDGDLYMRKSTDGNHILVLDPQTLDQRRSITLRSNSSDFVFGPDGRMYVSIPFARSIDVYDSPTGNRIDWDPSTPEVDPFVRPAEFEFPGGGIVNDTMAFAPDGDLFLLGSHSIKRYDGRIGRLKGDFQSSPSTEPFPSWITFGPDGLLYATFFEGTVDNRQGRIERFDPVTGASLGTFISGPAVSSPGSIVFLPEPTWGGALAALWVLTVPRRRRVTGASISATTPRRPRSSGPCPPARNA